MVVDIVCEFEKEKAIYDFLVAYFQVLMGYFEVWKGGGVTMAP